MKAIIALTAGTLAVLSLVVVLAGGLFQDSASAKEDFCGSLDNLATTVMNYQGLDPATATNEELDNAADDITEAWDDVVNDGDDWANAYDNPLTNAYDDLSYAAEDLPDDNTVAEDLDALQPQLEAFPQAFRDTFDGSGCSDSETEA
jgi:hypothetical protein